MNPLRPRALLLTLLLLAPMAALGASAIEAAPDPLAGYPEGSVLMENGDIAIPLRAETPEDYTDAIHRKVVAAGDVGLAYDAVNDREVPVAANFLFIRPGAWMWSPAWCTMNFIYGTPGSFKIGSAGHCAEVNKDIVLVVYPGVFAKIGKVSASHDNGPGDDWLLADITSTWQPYVDANVAVIGGPQNGAYTGVSYVGLATKHFGHGLGVGTGGTARAGHALIIRDTFWSCACVAAPGDSGSAMLVVTPGSPLGQGLGVLTHLIVGSGGPIGGTLLNAVPATIRNGDVNPLPPG